MDPASQKLFSAEIAGMTVDYYLIECEVDTDTGTYRRYGVALDCSDGRREEFPDIFSAFGEAAEFLSTLRRCEVTPTTLGDIVYDHLCQEDMTA